MTIFYKNYFAGAENTRGGDSLSPNWADLSNNTTLPGQKTLVKWILSRQAEQQIDRKKVTVHKQTFVKNVRIK